MEITHEFLLDRIKADPVGHIGAFSPQLLDSYFSGYDDARAFHKAIPVEGRLGLREFSEWFYENCYSGNQGFASFCRLLTDTDEAAFELFYELRGICLERHKHGPPNVHVDAVKYAHSQMSLTDFVLHESLRTRTAMYFGSEHWIRGMWAMCSGYLWAERDLGIENSGDAQRFAAFQKWIDERHPFAQGKNWGKVIEFLGMGINERARDEFYDQFESFLEGTAPNEPSKKCREWIAACLANVKERQTRGEL